MRITVLDKNMRPRFSSFSRIVTVIGNVAGAILNKVILRREARPLNQAASGREKVRALVHRHINIDGFEQFPVHKPFA